MLHCYTLYYKINYTLTNLNFKQMKTLKIKPTLQQMKDYYTEVINELPKYNDGTVQLPYGRTGGDHFINIVQMGPDYSKLTYEESMEWLGNTVQFFGEEIMNRKFSYFEGEFENNGITLLEELQWWFDQMIDYKE